MSRNVALIVGVTGIAGNSLSSALQSPTVPGAPWRIHGIARRPRPSWFIHGKVDYIECNLLDKSDAVLKLSHLSEVTHIFYVTWTKEDTEEKNCEANGNMFHNLLDTIIPVAKNLQHICLQTGAKHYLGPYTHFGTIQHYDVPFTEDMPRVSQLPNFYYTQEDILHSIYRSNPGISWSVHRPNIIFGIAPRNYANVLGSLSIYASICKRTGLSFVFPGDQRAWENLTNISDADLIAEQEIWAATNLRSQNQAFNITNGDCTTWKRLWRVLAREFKLEMPVYTGQPTNLARLMRDKGDIWEGIVREYSLVESELSEEKWWAVDLCLNFPFQIVSCMNKSKEHGFLGFRNTEKSTGYWIRKMKDMRIIPNDSFWM